VESVGDTGLLPGSVIDKFEFRAKNMELMNCVKVKDPGESDFRQGDIVPRDHFDQENLRVESTGAKKAEWVRPKPAAASTASARSKRMPCTMKLAPGARKSKS